MYSIDQAHGIRHLLDMFERYKWKYQYEKKKDIEDTLRNLYEIDVTIKQIRIESPHILQFIQEVDKEIFTEFAKESSTIIRKLINLMKHEDENLLKLNEAFSHHTAISTIAQDKMRIELEEIPEVGYAKGLEECASRMIIVIKHIYNRTKNVRLKELIPKLKKVVKDMKKFEKIMKNEEEIVALAKKQVHI